MGNIADLVVARTEGGLEVNSDKTKYMAMSRDVNDVKLTIQR
jgi:hypothetical protein